MTSPASAETDATPDSLASPARAISGSLSADDFKTLFRGHPGGVAVITADDGSGPVALTATSVASVSAEPPLLVFSVSAISSAAPVITSAHHVVIHLLDADDLDIAKLGATSGIDRFADESLWSRLVTGEPVFHGVRAWVRCAIVQTMDAGGSTIVAAHALQSSVQRDVTPDDPGRPLVYHNRAWHRLGDHSRVE